MTARKKASVDLCAEIFEILKIGTKQMEDKIKFICKRAHDTGDIAATDYFKVHVMGMVRHHFIDEQGLIHNETHDANLINHKWPEKKG